MSPDTSANPSLPRVPVSLARAVAPWKRAASATTELPQRQAVVTGFRPDRGRLADYRTLMGSQADLPMLYPQLDLTALHLDLISAWSFPVRAMGLIHPGFVIEVLDELPAEGPWDLRVWISGARHVRSGLEFDLGGEISSGGRVCWRSRAVTLSRSRTASGAEESTSPRLDLAGPWPHEQVLPAPEGTGRAYARVSGDVNPIHMHAVSARLLGFRRPIAHGWWIAGRSAAALGADEAVAGRTLEIGFRRPVELPSAPLLCSRSDGGVTEFVLLPQGRGGSGGPAGPGSSGDPVDVAGGVGAEEAQDGPRPLVSGRVSDTPIVD